MSNFMPTVWTARAGRMSRAPDIASRPRSPRRLMARSLASSRLASTTPSEVQVLVHAEVGEGYASGRPVSVAYMLTDRDGRVVDQQAVSPRLFPVLDGVPSERAECVWRS